MNEEQTSPPSAPREPMRIDVAAVLKSRLGGRKLPAWLVHRIESLVCQDRLNTLLRLAWPRRGADFCHFVTRHLDVEAEVVGRENLPSSPRILAVSNHPLGGLDGMMLIEIFSEIYGSDIKFVVNDLLSAVEPLSEVFLPINKHGAQNRRSVRAIDEAFQSDRPVLMFPAGLCSRLRGGEVTDLEWQKMFVAKARQTGRPIVPVHFVAENSPRFYRWARLRERLGLKFNFEMVLLPSEVFRAAGARFQIRIGRPIPAESLGADLRREAARIRQIVLSL